MLFLNTCITKSSTIGSILNYRNGFWNLIMKTGLTNGICTKYGLRTVL